MVLLSTVKTRSRSTFDSLYAFASFTYFKIPASRSSATTITATETIANLRLFFISKLYQIYADYAIFFYKITDRRSAPAVGNAHTPHKLRCAAKILYEIMLEGFLCLTKPSKRAIRGAVLLAPASMQERFCASWHNFYSI